MHVIYSICQKVAILDNSHIVEQGSVEKYLNHHKAKLLGDYYALESWRSVIMNIELLASDLRYIAHEFN